ncbi:dinitrogenase iron-molybdenum cofactor N-terminal domain-containing protein [Stutzerimonas azotifigens]|uniref:dinitrogenase iron-molybdenum cofactor N-terminal domain-containing protein n=1 Tax=Stutzerimonas azotifigens TaxID=291995 RepID=UPI0003FB31CB|nr:dinitrogenase iron-molybdenum cofactor N-terminal domain-containing protein [Stutzerimonas azotifigens]
MVPGNGRAPLPAHLALRIALAARELSGVETAQLLQALLSVTGEPITEARLARLRPNRLRNRLLDMTGGMAPGERQLQRAISLLKGRGVRMPEEPLPAVEPYREGELPDSIRIACSSDGGERLDGSFGSCARFLVYQISPSASRLVALREPGPVAPHEDRHASRAELLHDCQLLYTLSIGGPAAAKVIRVGTHPIKVSRPIPAREIVEELQQVLAAAPPPWLAKAMGGEPAARRASFSGKEETP